MAHIVLCAMIVTVMLVQVSWSCDNYFLVRIAVLRP